MIFKLTLRRALLLLGSLLFALWIGVSVRNAGGVHYSQVNVVVSDSVGPFLVTNPNTSIVWNTGASVPVTWDAAGTSAP